jgi:CubicO group peptidase (beta-lactamase class C family)
LTRFNYPAIWAAISVRGKIVAVVASGLRKLNYSEKVTPTDKLMIGSTSKPVTGTLIGILIDKGVLKWETTVREALPELSKEFDRPWLDATVLQLLTHLSGCPLLPSKSRRGTEGDRISLRYQYQVKNIGIRQGMVSQ